MNKLAIFLICSITFFNCDNSTNINNQQEARETGAGEEASSDSVVLIIHGGASYISERYNNDSMDVAFKQIMSEALAKGRDVIINGGSSVDAVQAAINIMEDAPIFNAGKGAVFSSAGMNELDACIMEGKTLNAGAVASVTTIKNPINAARLVMDSSEHVFLAGDGAEKYAREKGLEIVDNKYFFTQNRWDEWQEVVKKENAGAKESAEAVVKNQKYGTVGAVALDLNGNLAAGTSTGGRTNKKYGRIGDSPIIGASTYADNRYCGVSSTGWGEMFIRHCTAHSVVSMMEHKGASVNEAAEGVMYEKMKDIEGGIIALDRKGNISMAFNTPVMNRGYITLTGDPKVFIYKEERE